MISRHYHWKFMAHNDEIDAKEIHMGVTVEVIGDENETDAKIAATSVVRRKNYYLVAVWECNTCGFQVQVSNTMEKMIK